MKQLLINLLRKELAFDRVGREYYVDPRFYWITHTCDRLHPTEMATSHLFNALKMMWNNSVPEQYRIQPYRKWGGIPQMQTNYKRQAIKNLLAELMNRPDRTKGMDNALQQMYNYMKKFPDMLLEGW
jgi:hypothetical protein